MPQAANNCQPQKVAISNAANVNRQGGVQLKMGTQSRMLAKSLSKPREKKEVNNMQDLGELAKVLSGCECIALKRIYALKYEYFR